MLWGTWTNLIFSFESCSLPLDKHLKNKPHPLYPHGLITFSMNHQPLMATLSSSPNNILIYYRQCDPFHSHKTHVDLTISLISSLFQTSTLRFTPSDCLLTDGFFIQIRWCHHLNVNTTPHLIFLIAWVVSWQIVPKFCFLCPASGFLLRGELQLFPY